MKYTFFICLMIAGATNLHGQTGASHGKWEENNDSKKVVIQQDIEYANTEMSYNRMKITFSDLPEVRKGTLAVLTNPLGEVLSQKKVDPVNNTMDIHWLNRGELYYITLVYKNKNKKGFTLRY